MFEQKFNDAKEDEDRDDDERIILDRSAFKALASDTRVNILKELDKRRKTLTEISEVLNLAVATVKEHMDQLSKSNLISIKDEGRKWKYYELTEKGKAILYPERKKIWVMLMSVVFMIVLSLYMTHYDLGYISSGRLLSSDASDMGAFSDMRMTRDISSAQYDTSQDNQDDEVGALGALVMETDVDEDIYNGEMDDEDYLDSYMESGVVDYEILENNEEYLTDIEHVDLEYTKDAPYLRYVAYGVTLVSLIVLLLFVNMHIEKRRKNVARKTKKKY